MVGRRMGRNPTSESGQAHRHTLADGCPCGGGKGTQENEKEKKRKEKEKRQSIQRGHIAFMVGSGSQLISVCGLSLHPC